MRRIIMLRFTCNNQIDTGTLGAFEVDIRNAEMQSSPINDNGTFLANKRWDCGLF